jgi:hypothetical protein
VSCDDDQHIAEAKGVGEEEEQPVRDIHIYTCACIYGESEQCTTF